MRAIVLAYAEVGYRCLRVLIDAGIQVPLVFTHLDDPRESVRYRSVAALARENGIPVHTPEDVDDPRWVARMRDADADVLFSFYYRRLVGREVLDVPRIGAFNLHGSLLPRYRGRAPVNWALLEGATETGVTLHEMVERADAGDIVAQRRIPIEDEDDAATLSEKVAAEAETLLREWLPQLRAGRVTRRRQRLSEGWYRGRRTPEDGRIDWSRPLDEIRNLVRAVTEPWPGAFTVCEGRKLIVWRARPAGRATATTPGLVRVDGGPVVDCGDGRLRLLRWQLDGEAPREAGEGGDFAPLADGCRLG